MREPSGTNGLTRLQTTVTNMHEVHNSSVLHNHVDNSRTTIVLL